MRKGERLQIQYRKLQQEREDKEQGYIQREINREGKKERDRDREMTKR